MVVALVWHNSSAVMSVFLMLGLGATFWCFIRLKPALKASKLRGEILPTLNYLLLSGLIVVTAMFGYETGPKGDVRILAWPWYVPIGSIVALGGAYLLSPANSDPSHSDKWESETSAAR